MGLHHSGVEVLGREYSFASGGGIFDSTPKDAPGASVSNDFLGGENCTRVRSEYSLSTSECGASLGGSAPGAV